MLKLLSRTMNTTRTAKIAYRAFIFFWVVGALASFNELITSGGTYIRPDLMAWLLWGVRALLLPWGVLILWRHCYRSSGMAVSKTELWVRRVYYTLWVAWALLCNGLGAAMSGSVKPKSLEELHLFTGLQLGLWAFFGMLVPWLILIAGVRMNRRFTMKKALV